MVADIKGKVLKQFPTPLVEGGETYYFYYEILEEHIDIDGNKVEIRTMGRKLPYTPEELTTFKTEEITRLQQEISSIQGV